jgi:hypothetical protein
MRDIKTASPKELLSKQQLIGFKRATGGGQVLVRASSAKVTTIESFSPKAPAKLAATGKPRT